MSLSQDLLFELADAAIRAGVPRSALLNGLPVGYIALLSTNPAPKVQQMLDLAHLNRHPELIGFTGHPIVRWLHNLAGYAHIPSDRALVVRALEALGAPPLAEPESEPEGEPVPDLPQDLIDVLAEEYPDVSDARAVWKRAGGTNRDVVHSPKPQDLWQNLWARSVRGASVQPAALLRAAMKDLPNNAVLIKYLRLYTTPPRQD